MEAKTVIRVSEQASLEKREGHRQTQSDGEGKREGEECETAPRQSGWLSSLVAFRGLSYRDFFILYIIAFFHGSVIQKKTTRYKKVTENKDEDE